MHATVGAMCGTLSWRSDRSSGLSLAPLGTRLARESAVQFVRPVQHDMNLRQRRWFLLHRFEHEEPLTVGGHIIVGANVAAIAAHVRSFEELPRRTREEFPLRADVHGHHPVATAVKQF